MIPPSQARDIKGLALAVNLAREPGTPDSVEAEPERVAAWSATVISAFPQRLLGMCDIYTARCAICGSPVPMHLGDFLTGRDEISVFCPKHSLEEVFQRVPPERCYAIRLESLEEAMSRIESEVEGGERREVLLEMIQREAELASGTVVICCHTVNAVRNWAVNHPNTALDWEVVWLFGLDVEGKSLGELEALVEANIDRIARGLPEGGVS